MMVTPFVYHFAVTAWYVDKQKYCKITSLKMDQHFGCIAQTVMTTSVNRSTHFCLVVVVVQSKKLFMKVLRWKWQKKFSWKIRLNLKKFTISQWMYYTSSVLFSGRRHSGNFSSEFNKDVYTKILTKPYLCCNVGCKCKSLHSFEIFIAHLFLRNAINLFQTIN